MQGIQEINLKGSTIIRMLVKAKLKHKFKFEKILSARIVANHIEDTYDVSAKGYIKGDIRVCERHLDPGKLSDQKDTMTLVIEKVKEHLTDFKSLSAAFTFIDFEKNTCTTDTFFLKNNGVKDSKQFKFDF